MLWQGSETLRHWYRLCGPRHRHLLCRDRSTCDLRRQGRVEDRAPPALRDSHLRARPRRDGQRERERRAPDVHDRPRSCRPRCGFGLHRRRHSAHTRRRGGPERGVRSGPGACQARDPRPRHRQQEHGPRRHECSSPQAGLGRQVRYSGGFESGVPQRGRGDQGLHVPRPHRGRCAPWP